MEYISEDDILNMEIIDFMIKARELLNKHQGNLNQEQKSDIISMIANLFTIKNINSRTEIRRCIAKQINSLINS